MKLKILSKKFWQFKIKHPHINVRVKPNEKLIRLAVGLSNFKLFDPRKAGNKFEGISLIRLRYSNFDFCKNHAKTEVQNPTKNSFYYGMAMITYAAIKEIYKQTLIDTKREDLNDRSYWLPILYYKINYRFVLRFRYNVESDMDINFPSHSNFNIFMKKIEKGKPKPPILAAFLSNLNKLNYVSDSNPRHLNWLEGDTDLINNLEACLNNR